MFFEISERVKDLSATALKKAETVFGRIDELTEYNQQKVLSAFIRNRVDETDFNTTTGYGYSDKGREKLDVLTADIFGAESAIIRSGALSSGTHTLAVCLYGILRPNDLMLSITGKPYDTMDDIIHGKDGEDIGSLKDFGIRYKQVDMIGDEINISETLKIIKEEKPKMVYLQRSRGYSSREALSVYYMGVF